MFAARLSSAFLLLGAAGCGASSPPADAPPPTPATSVAAVSGGSAPSASVWSEIHQPEQQVIAMCRGSASIFTEKEENLLGLAESIGSANMKDWAKRARAARQDAVDAACTRLRAEGKL